MALENRYGKSAVDATRRNALPPYLDELFAGGIGGAGVETHDITLTTSGWSNLQQSIVLTCGATDSSDVVCAANNTSMDSDYYMSAFGVSLSNVTVVEGEEEGQNTVTFTFTAVTVPTVNIDVVVIIVNADSSGGVPVATTSRVGVVKPDGTTITVDSNGTIHSIGSVGTVSGVKGNAESTYRTGNVNITPANIGISKAVQVSDSPISLTQTGSEMQTLLNNIPIGKFRLLSATNSTELDDIPSINAEWICGIFDTAWANRPCDYGLCYRMTAPTQQWSYEIAHEAGNSPTIYYRASTNGYAWTSWTNVGRAKTSSAEFTLTDTTNFNIASQQLYRFGSMRVLTLVLATKTAINIGSYTIGTIASGDRPLYSVSNYIGREDSGSQGMGTVTVSPNGNVVYGVNITGVSGVTIKTQIVWFV